MMPRILVVEDKLSVRITVEAVLGDAGYDVECVVDGHDAIRALQAQDADYFDLIVSDIMMPNVNGVELVTGIRAMNNQMPILLMSGGGYNMVADSILDGLKGLADGVLKKPFTNEELLVEVSKVLGEKLAAS